jgi:hypothetical protein
MITKNFPWPGDTRDGFIFDGVAWQQIAPRLMVDGDIGDWADVVYWNFVKGEVKRLAAAKDEIERRCVNLDKLESELRQEKTITNCYMRAAERRLTRMRELQAAVDDKDNFIQMQAQQLKNARADVARLRQRSDFTTLDNGPT